MAPALHISACVVLLIGIVRSDLQEGIIIHITGPAQVILGNPVPTLDQCTGEDDFCVDNGGQCNVTTLEQCTGEDGFCVDNGGHCNGTINTIYKTPNDHCICCLPEKKPEQKACGTKERCTKLGKRIGVLSSCQPKEEICDGKRVAGKKLCSDYKTCDCCIPQPPPPDCGKTKPACAKVLGTCQPKTDNCTTGLLLTGQKYCKNWRNCGCCTEIACESPWVYIEDHGCFRSIVNIMTWDNARTACQNNGGDLAILDVSSKRTAVNIHLQSFFRFRHWVGANDRSGSWRWLNSVHVTDGWASGPTGWKDHIMNEPNFDWGNDTCMWINPKQKGNGSHALWDDICTDKHFALCEK